MEHLLLVEFMKSNRNPTEEEILIISFLATKANYSHNNWEKGLKVVEMNDGGMGSLLLMPVGQVNTKRLFKAQISDVIFKDLDGIDVIVSLNIDQDDFLYELDVWKVNYDKLISFDNLLNFIKERQSSERPTDNHIKNIIVKPIQEPDGELATQD